MGDVEETTHRPVLNGATRSYIVTAVVCFLIVGLLLVGYAQEEAAKKAKESPAATASGTSADGQPLSDEQATRNQKVDDLARKSQGKFDALDKSDQDFLNGLTSGHGQQMLQTRWQALNEAKTDPASPQFNPDAKIREIVARTKGDYSKVTAEEKARMNEVTNGHGQQYFETRVQLWKKSLQEKSGQEPQKSP